MAQMAETEKKRIEEQRKNLGEDGLKNLAEKLEKAKKENEVRCYLPYTVTGRFNTFY